MTLNPNSCTAINAAPGISIMARSTRPYPHPKAVNLVRVWITCNHPRHRRRLTFSWAVPKFNMDEFRDAWERACDWLGHDLECHQPPSEEAIRTLIKNRLRIEGANL